jgi:hypothetical protein
MFFALTTLAALPGIVMVVWLMRRFPRERLSVPARVAVDD